MTRYEAGEAWAWLENGESKILGSTEDELLFAPTKYDEWDRGFMASLTEEARQQRQGFSAEELRREFTQYWMGLYNAVDTSWERGHYGRPGDEDYAQAAREKAALDKAYDSWANGPPLFTLGT